MWMCRRGIPEEHSHVVAMLCVYWCCVVPGEASRHPLQLFWKVHRYLLVLLNLGLCHSDWIVARRRDPRLSCATRGERAGCCGEVIDVPVEANSRSRQATRCSASTPFLHAHVRRSRRSSISDLLLAAETQVYERDSGRLLRAARQSEVDQLKAQLEGGSGSDKTVVHAPPTATSPPRAAARAARVASCRCAGQPSSTLPTPSSAVEIAQIGRQISSPPPTRCDVSSSCPSRSIAAGRSTPAGDCNRPGSDVGLAMTPKVVPRAVRCRIRLDDAESRRAIAAGSTVMPLFTPITSTVPRIRRYCAASHHELRPIIRDLRRTHGRRFKIGLMTLINPGASARGRPVQLGFQDLHHCAVRRHRSRHRSDLFLSEFFPDHGVHRFGRPASSSAGGRIVGDRIGSQLKLVRDNLKY